MSAEGNYGELFDKKTKKINKGRWTKEEVDA